MAEEIRIEPRDPSAARAEIEQTRARMSRTIDEIEGVILREKAKLRTQLDVVARIRERPLPAAGIALGVGLLLGLATGGGRRRRIRARTAERRADRWETRARRLLEIARDQEEEIGELEDALDASLLEAEDLECEPGLPEPREVPLRDRDEDVGFRTRTERALRDFFRGRF